LRAGVRRRPTGRCARGDQHPHAPRPCVLHQRVCAADDPQFICHVHLGPALAARSNRLSSALAAVARRAGGCDFTSGDAPLVAPASPFRWTLAGRTPDPKVMAHQHRTHDNDLTVYENAPNLVVRRISGSRPEFLSDGSVTGCCRDGRDRADGSRSASSRATDLRQLAANAVRCAAALPGGGPLAEYTRSAIRAQPIRSGQALQEVAREEPPPGCCLTGIIDATSRPRTPISNGKNEPENDPIWLWSAACWPSGLECRRRAQETQTETCAGAARRSSPAAPSSPIADQVVSLELRIAPRTRVRGGRSSFTRPPQQPHAGFSQNLTC